MKNQFSAILVAISILHGSAFAGVRSQSEIYPQSPSDPWMIKVIEVGEDEMRIDLCRKGNITQCVRTLGNRNFSKNFVQHIFSQLESDIRRMDGWDYAGISVAALVGFFGGAQLTKSSVPRSQQWILPTLGTIALGGGVAFYKWSKTKERILDLFSALSMDRPGRHQVIYNDDIRDLAKEIEEFLVQASHDYT